MKERFSFKNNISFRLPYTSFFMHVDISSSSVLKEQNHESATDTHWVLQQIYKC